MNIARIACFLIGSALPAVAQPGGLNPGHTVSQGGGAAVATMPPLPPASPPIDEKNAKIDPAVRSRVEAAHSGWLRNEGAPFASSLTYLAGRPVLTLMAPEGEPEQIRSRRFDATFAAFEFILDRAGFSSATVCVIHHNPKTPSIQRVKNYLVDRSDFEDAAKKAGKNTDLKAALKAVRSSDELAGRMAAALGLN